MGTNHETLRQPEVEIALLMARFPIRQPLTQAYKLQWLAALAISLDEEKGTEPRMWLRDQLGAIVIVVLTRIHWSPVPFGIADKEATTTQATEYPFPKR
jgi:hypothetical protein